MQLITNVDIITGVMIPVALYLIKKIIDWIGNMLGNLKSKMIYRFNEIPVDIKVSILAKIDALKEKPLTAHVVIQMKFLYERLGIYLPVWHCHQLISYMADKNTSSIDVRLRGFLKNPVVSLCSENGYKVNIKSAHWLCAIYGLIGIFAIAVFIYSGWDAICSFWDKGNAVLFILFSLAYASAIIFVASTVLDQIEDILQGIKFGRLFETWINTH